VSKSARMATNVVKYTITIGQYYRVWWYIPCTFRSVVPRV